MADLSRTWAPLWLLVCITHRNLIHHPQDTCEERRRPNKQNKKLVRVIELHVGVWVIIKLLYKVRAQVCAGGDLTTEHAE